MIAPAEAPFAAVEPLVETVFPVRLLLMTWSVDPPLTSIAPPSAKLDAA